MEVNDVRYIFDTSVLKKGDILLINTHNERMHLLMKSQYDHVALYAGDAFIMESDGGGVVLNHIFSYGFKKVDDAIVLRCKSDSELIREGVVFYARSTMGMEFGSLEARKVPKYEATEKPAESNRMFCSRLVALSYDKMGVNLVPNPNYCTPASFMDSDKLVRVYDALVPATDAAKQVFAIHSKVRENAENVEMLVSMYGRMSEIYGADIQAMDQLIKTALQKPEKDDEAVIALYDTDFYKRRFEGRGLYCLNDRDAFYKKYDSLDRRMWFLLNQDSHLDNTYIPSITANVQTFSVLSSQHPNSKVVAFFRDFFKEQLNELMDYQVWVGTMLVETVENNPEGVKSIIKNEINR